MNISLKIKCEKKTEDKENLQEEKIQYFLGANHSYRKAINGRKGDIHQN